MYESYINKIEDVGKLRNLKPGTIRTYKNNVRDFLKFINKHPEDLTCEDARDFLLYLKDKGDKSSTLNNKNGSLVFFYKRVLGKLWDDNLVPRAINDYAIPRVLTREEVERLLDATPNLKYKAMFSLMYSSGLRVSEVVHLHYDDISRTNMTIHVRETKGRIDRYTILSQKNLDLLTEYWYKCGRPKDILFPSSWSGGYLDIASVNQFFKKSAKLAGINRHVSSHACRHSFASHLFESGTDIKYIQSLLGHVDPRSTDVYLHVSNKTLLGIRSPFDNPEGGES